MNDLNYKFIIQILNIANSNHLKMLFISGGFFIELFHCIMCKVFPLYLLSIFISPSAPLEQFGLSVIEIAVALDCNLSIALQTDSGSVLTT